MSESSVEGFAGSAGALGSMPRVAKATDATADLPATNTLKDGTFTGEGMGNNGTIAVEVTIVDVEKDGKEMIDRVLQAQSADVDTIAGATYSSEGFLSAVNKALEQAGQ